MRERERGLVQKRLWMLMQQQQQQLSVLRPCIQINPGEPVPKNIHSFTSFTYLQEYYIMQYLKFLHVLRSISSFALFSFGSDSLLSQPISRFFVNRQVLYRILYNPCIFTKSFTSFLKTCPQHINLFRSSGKCNELKYQHPLRNKHLRCYMYHIHKTKTS